MRYRLLLVALLLVVFAGPVLAQQGTVEIVRDQWGVPHVFAEREADAFFGLGYACAEDRLMQMELLRRRARGRLAELFGAKFVDSDRKFRIAGISRYCAQAFAGLPGLLHRANGSKSRIVI